MAAVHEEISAEEFRREVLEFYPPKIAKKRARQIIVNNIDNDRAPEIMANARTVPGIITMRGCA